MRAKNLIHKIFKVDWGLMLFAASLVLSTSLAKADSFGDFIYTTNLDSAIITGYSGSGGAVVIPDTIIGLPVVSLENSAFWSFTNLTDITIPETVTNIGFATFASCSALTRVTIPEHVAGIGSWAFLYCDNLTGLYFEGNSPWTGSSICGGDDLATIYYLSGTTNWGATFVGHPTALWLPEFESGADSFGVLSNQFGFNIIWAGNRMVVVETTTNLIDSVWVPLQTNTLVNGSYYFSDPQWTNYPGRFYRLRGL